MSSYRDIVDFSVLEGLTLEAIYKEDDDVLLFATDGGVYRMFHEQDCCERVWVEDVTGDPADLAGALVTLAEETSNTEDTKWGSQTWTFYKLATPKGDLTIRWLGESNGYYSESVSLYRWDQPIPEGATPLEASP